MKRFTIFAHILSVKTIQHKNIITIRSDNVSSSQHNQVIRIMIIFNIVVWGLVAAGFIAIYLPRLFVVHKEKLSGKQFVKRYPEFLWWIQIEYWVDFFLFFLLFLGAFRGIIWLQTPLSFGLFSIVMAGMAFFNGFLTISTGIYRVPYPKMPYLYIFDINLRRIGWYQVILSAITILTAISLAFYRGPL